MRVKLNLIFAAALSDGTVAQLDRASDYGSEGLGFDSLRCHKKNPWVKARGFFIVGIVNEIIKVMSIA